MADVVELIKLQHRRIDELLGQAESAELDRVADALRQVAELLVPHSHAEESFVYPAIRDYEHGEAKDVEDSLAEHHHIEELMRELMEADPSDPGFDGRLAAMIGEVRHHVEEEESTLLPVLAEQADDDERDELGARFAEMTGHRLEDEAAQGSDQGGGRQRSGRQRSSRQGKGAQGKGAQGSGRPSGGGRQGEGRAAQTSKGPGSGAGESGSGDKSREELYQEAKKRGISGRSGMSKEELARALDARD